MNTRDAGSREAWERWLALLGLLPFALQTVVLDALVWPAYFFGPGTTAGVSS